jgi:MFS family permease
MISRKWPADSEWSAWVLSTYNIVGAVATPIAGSLSDIYGPRWVAIFVLLVYVVGQVGCALAPNIFVLIAFRAVQGVGMAIFTINFSVIRKTFPPKFVPAAIGAVSVCFSFGMSVGLVGGSATMDALGEKNFLNVFWTTAPVVLVLVVLFYFVLPSNDQLPPGSTNKSKRVDWIGAPILSAGVVLFLCGITLSERWGWRHGGTISITVIGAVLMIAFFVLEKFVPDPLISLRLLMKRDLFFACVYAFMVGLSIFSLFQVFPYLLASPTNTILPIIKKPKMFWVSLCLLPFGISQLVIAPLVSLTGKKFGFSNFASIAIVVICIGCGLLIKYHYTLGQVLPILIVMGMSMATTMISMMNIVSGATEPKDFGAATGTNTLFRIVGGAIGPVIVSLVMNRNPLRIPTTTWVVDSSDSTSSGVDPVVSFLTVPSDKGFKNAFSLLVGLIAFTSLITIGISGHDTPCKNAKKKRATGPSDVEIAKEEAKAEAPVINEPAKEKPEAPSS